MKKLNFLLYPNMQDYHICKDYSLSILENNIKYEKTKKEFLSKYGFNDLKTISFSKAGVLGLFLELGGKIAVSLGESQAVIDAMNEYEKLGFEVVKINLNKDGKVNLDDIKSNTFDHIFISSYVMDTFVKTDLSEVKKLTKATIISNSSAYFDKNCHIAIFDSYKLCGYSSSAVVLFNDEVLEEQAIGFTDALSVFLTFEALKNFKTSSLNKEFFIEKLKENFGDDFYFFVQASSTLEYTLHFGLKNIKAREMIRTLALQNILITNGEGCSLGLSKPSRVIQAMGYDELTSRNAISLSFFEELSKEDISKIAKEFHKKYRQIRVLNEQ